MKLQTPNPDLQTSVKRQPPASTEVSYKWSRTVHRFVREDGICILTFDRPNSSANIFDRLTLTELTEELEFIAGAPQLKGLVLTSAKRSIFIAGADLKSMSEAESSDEIRELVQLGQAVMNRLAALPIPTVAAIHGAAVRLSSRSFPKSVRGP